MFGFKKRRRQRLMKQPLPQSWQAIIQRKVPYVQQLPADQQKKLNALIQVFLDEKAFEGCGGLTVTDEIKLVIAAQACVLLLGLTDIMYPVLRSVLVYPKNFYSSINQTNSGGVVTEGQVNRSGESWSRGHVILSWNQVQNGMRQVADGHNVVFHEFAHQMDETFEITKGGQPQNAPFKTLQNILSQEYHRLVRQINNQQPTLFRAYGATNQAEFFAVATECFFEQPQPFKQDYPELYQQLQAFYQQDPVYYFKKHSD